MAGGLVVACNLLSGASDLEVVPDDASIANDGGATGDSASSGDGSADAKPIVDTGPPPTCPSAGHSCTKAPPSGWQGPVLLYVGKQAEVPSCPSEMPESTDSPTGDPTGSFTCECRCGGVNGAQCKAFLQGWNNAGCTGAFVEELDLGSCQTPGSDSSFRADARLVTNGSCNAFAGFKTKAPAQFDAMLRACGRPTSFASDGCGSGELCVPDGVAPFKAHTCIVSDDPAAVCPAPWTDLHHAWADADDDRACNRGSCGCGEPAGTTCSGNMRTYGAATDCTGASQLLPLPVAQCTTASAASSQRVITLSLAANGGSCPTVGAPTPAGGVRGTGGSVVCCLP